MKSKGSASRYTFTLVILCILMLSIFFPQPGLFAKEIGMSPVLTFLAMFVSGLSLSFENVRSSMKEYKTILFSSVVTFVIFPILAFTFTRLLFPGNEDLFIGTMILSTQASTISSAIVLTMAAGGNVPLAIVITVLNNFLSVFISPIILNGVFLMGNRISFNTIEMIRNLIMVVVMPIIIAQIIKHVLKTKIKYLNKLRKPVANLVVIMFVMIGASTAAPQLSGNYSIVLLVVLFALILHLAVVLIGYLYAKVMRLKKEDVPALVFCSAEKTMTSSILIWNNHFASYTLAPILFVFNHIVQIFLDSILANLWANAVDNEAAVPLQQG
ncbi:MAG: bile acid:sodium symporter [Caldicoprobacterales bacterium]|nr:bile acid:sodium symporter [Clostridiales bacterium]